MKHALNWESALALLLVLEILLFGWANPRMLNIETLLFSTSDFITVGIVALPLTLVIVSGGIDISFASVTGLCAIALGVMLQSQWPLPLALLCTLILGFLCGCFNGFLILWTGVNPLVITLGTLYLFGGGALLLSGLAGATGFEGIGNFPDAFTNLVNLTPLGMPMPLLLFVLLSLVFWGVMHRTRTGRYIFLLGQNACAARYGALPVNRTLFLLYGLVGLASAIAAVVMSAYFGSARADLGTPLLMPAITAVVLGGANIYGGAGSVMGTALATLVIGFLQQGLQMVGVSSQVSNALSGALLIFAVIGRSWSLNPGIVRQMWRRIRARMAHRPASYRES
ncbi:autoinducer 2 ABC transporter permease LsrD [Enterobacter cancerogenus]|uniref:autoinducer 2 ABC transporter permease LsrD n=1 Tax=Enterobacter cancerogenus TaxID=69218 RepID=UPI000536B246|nr:autoinducer 2 ABC transporter permease LsrD [Enterobacter cancerogenus]KGT90877.1 autoinducer 2 import system permease LsrD [Enterobacter cancerogenus]